MSEAEVKSEKAKADKLIKRLENLLPELVDGRATHIYWRDCLQKYRDENPDIGSKEFHSECVELYDNRISVVSDTIEFLKSNHH